MTDKDFIDYVKFTLAPDLMQEGRTETANDLVRLCRIAEKLQDKIDGKVPDRIRPDWFSRYTNEM